MFSHVMVGSDDIARSQKFYDALLGALGGGAATVDDKGRLFYMHNNGIFAVTSPIDGNAASGGNGGTIGFACASEAMVDAWHAAGVANGGVSIEDPPGVRESPLGPLYLAYLRDPDGNLIGLMSEVRD